MSIKTNFANLRRSVRSTITCNNNSFRLLRQLILTPSFSTIKVKRDLMRCYGNTRNSTVPVGYVYPVETQSSAYQKRPYNTPSELTGVVFRRKWLTRVWRSIILYSLISVHRTIPTSLLTLFRDIRNRALMAMQKESADKHYVEFKGDLKPRRKMAKNAENAQRFSLAGFE